MAWSSGRKGQILLWRLRAKDVQIKDVQKRHTENAYIKYVQIKDIQKRRGFSILYFVFFFLLFLFFLMFFILIFLHVPFPSGLRFAFTFLLICSPPIFCPFFLLSFPPFCVCLNVLFILSVSFRGDGGHGPTEILDLTF